MTVTLFWVAPTGLCFFFLRIMNVSPALVSLKKNDFLEDIASPLSYWNIDDK